MSDKSTILGKKAKNMRMALKLYLDEYCECLNEQDKIFDKCLDHVLKNMELAHSAADCCAHCQKGEGMDRSLLAVPVETAEGTKDVWLHAGCIEGWNRERTEDAAMEVVDLGIESPFGWDTGLSARPKRG